MDILIVTAYVAIAFLFSSFLTERVGKAKLAEKEFAGYYFLKWSFSIAAFVQLGFIVLTSIVYHDKESIAVALAALIGIPGFLLVAMIIQNAFFRRYHRLPNLIKRLEQLSPMEREMLLQELPAKIFQQLPGDYRIVSYNSGPSRKI